MDSNTSSDGSSNPDGGDYLERTNGGTSFVGSDVNIFRCAVLVSSLRFYAKTGMRTTRIATPSRMLALAHEITGRKFKRGQYLEAADAVAAVAEAAKQAPRT